MLCIREPQASFLCIIQRMWSHAEVSLTVSLSRQETHLRTVSMPRHIFDAHKHHRVPYFTAPKVSGDRQPLVGLHVPWEKTAVPLSQILR